MERLAAAAVAISTSLSPTITARSARPPAISMVRIRCPGAGLNTSKVSRPAMAANRPSRPSVRSSSSRQMLDLVGADRQPRPGSEQVIEQLGDALERPARDRHVVGIEHQELIVQPVQLAVGSASVVEPQARIDHRLRAVADERVQLGNRDGREPQQPQGVIGRSRQVGRGVDQRAVEIENDCRVCEIEGHGVLVSLGGGNLFVFHAAVIGPLVCIAPVVSCRSTPCTARPSTSSGRG